MRIISFLILFVAFIVHNAVASDDQSNIELFEFLGNVKSLHAKFIQYNSDNNKSLGEIFLKKPGKLKISYVYPDKIDVIIKDKYLAFINHDLDERSFSDMDDNVFNILISSNEDISSSKFNIELSRKNELYIYNLKDGQNELMLTFSKDHKALKIISITYRNNETIDLYLEDLNINSAISDEVFNSTKKILD